MSTILNVIGCKQVEISCTTAIVDTKKIDKFDDDASSVASSDLTDCEGEEKDSRCSSSDNSVIASEDIECDMACELEDDDCESVEENTDGDSQSNRSGASVFRKTVRFDDSATSESVLLIPTRKEDQALTKELFWGPLDYDGFREDAVCELQMLEYSMGLEFKEALNYLYQPSSTRDDSIVGRLNDRMMCMAQEVEGEAQQRSGSVTATVIYQIKET